MNGRALFLAGELDAARAAYDAALRERPGDAGSLAGRAALRAYSGDAEGAAADAEAALQADPKCAEAWLVLGRLRNRAEDVDRALEIRPGWATALYWRGVLRESKDDLRAAAAAKSDDPLDLPCQASALDVLLDDRQALAASERALAAGYRLPSIFHLRARVKARRRDHRGAIEELDRLIAGPSPFPQYFVDRGRERLHLNQEDAAVEDFERALALKTDHIPAIYYRTMARAALDPVGAEAGYRRICAMEAVDADDFYFRGLAHERIDRPREAARDFALALKQAPLNHPRRAELEARQPESSEPAPRVAPASLVLLGASVAVWMVQGELLEIPDAETLVERGAIARGPVFAGEWWRMLTAMFLHIGPIHLVWNVTAGYSWCAPVEGRLGSVRFAVLFVMSGLAGSALSLIAHDVVAAGASGALFGAIGAVLGLWYVKLGSAAAFVAHRRVRSHLMMIGLWFLLGLTLMPMDNFAHLGGLLGGLVWTWIFLKRPTALAHLAAAALTLGLCAAAAVPWYAPDHRSWRYLKGARLASESGDHAEAERLATLAIETGRMPADGLANRGIARQRLGRLDEAMADYRGALEHEPRNVTAIWGVASILHERGDLAGAEREYDRAIELDARNPDLRVNRANLRIARGALDGAKDDLRSALDGAPPGWDASEARKLLKGLAGEGR